MLIRILLFVGLLVSTAVSETYELGPQNRDTLVCTRNLNVTTFDSWFRISAWGDECYMNVDMTPMILVADSHYEDVEVPIYPYTYLRDDGNFEWEFILTEKPFTNVFEFFYESEGLDFFFQDTALFSEIEYLIPDSCVYSYAVYHSSRRDNYIFESGHRVEYETGKAFHIYRPKAWDSRGIEIWCSMHINNGVFSLIIPKDFLEHATYPITVDPTFGYSSVGGTEAAPSTALGSIGNQVYTASTGDQVTQYSIYCRTIGAWTVYFTLYNVSGGLPVTRQFNPDATFGGAGALAVNWRNSNTVSQSLSGGQTYCIAIGDYVNYANQRLYTDLGSGTQRSLATTASLASTWTSSTTSASIYSIYATYIVSASVVDKFGPNVKFGVGVKNAK